MSKPSYNPIIVFDRETGKKMTIKESWYDPEKHLVADASEMEVEKEEKAEEVEAPAPEKTEEKPAPKPKKKAPAKKK